MGTVEGALAGLDHHDVLVEGLAILTAELDPDGAGLLGATAAAIDTGATVLGPVLLETGAASIGELHCLGGLLGPVALLSFLKTGVRRLGAWANFANAALLDQLAFTVVVGHSG